MTFMLQASILRRPFRRPSRLVRLSLLAGILLTGLGCKLVMMAGYLIGGPPSIEPDFDVQTKKSMTDYDVMVAVVVWAPKEVKFDDPKLEEDLEQNIAYKLHAKHVKTVTPQRVREWLDKHPKYDKAAELGADFKAKLKPKTFYVIDVELSDYSLYEKGSQTLHRGTAEIFIRVWEIDDNGEGTVIYNTKVNSMWPLAAPKSTNDIGQPQFRRRYLQRLAEEIGRKFYEHYNGDDLEEVT